MTYNLFNSLIENLKDLYDEGILHDQKLEKALGGDTRVVTSWYNSYIEKTLENIAEELNDKTELIDWFFFEVMCSPTGKPLSFEVDGKTYLGNTKNIWKFLNNELNEDDSLVKKVEQELTVNSILNEIYTAIKERKSLHFILFKYIEIGWLISYNIEEKENNLIIILDFGYAVEKITIKRNEYE